MGIFIKLLLIVGFIFVGYQYFGDEIKDKTANLRARTYEVINPEGKRADLLEDLDIKVKEVREIGQSLESIDLEKIVDPEIKQVLGEIKEKVSEGATNGMSNIVENIERLNDKDGPITRIITKIVEVVRPNSDPTPTPNENEVSSTPTPSSSPPAPQCHWVCE